MVGKLFSIRFRVALIASVVAMAGLFGEAAAQPFGPGSTFMGPGMMMGRHGFGMCGPAVSGFVEWRTERLVEDIKLSDSQRAKFEEFKAASVKAADTMRAACQQEIPGTIVDRAVAMEKRMDAMLQAIRATRPALEAFYATLDEDQKSKLNSPTERGWWHWRNYW